MNKRWLLSYDGTSYVTECTPENGGDVKFEDVRNLGAGQIFFRRHLNTELRFGNPEYGLWWAKRISAEPCLNIYIRREYFCAGVWKTWWTGRFTVSNANFNHDRCRVTIKPVTVDKYSCIMDTWKTTVNLLDIPRESVSMAPLFTGLEFRVCDSSPLVWPEISTSGNCADLVVDDGTPPSSGNYINGWNPEHNSSGWFDGQTPSAPGIGVFRNVGVVMREVYTTNCFDGLPVEPPGTSWVLVEDNCVLNGTSLWARNIQFAYSFGEPVVGSWLNGIPNGTPIPPDTGDCNYVFAGVADRLLNGNLVPVPWFMCLDLGISVQVYDSSRPLHSGVTHLLNNTDCQGAIVISDFFEWDPAGDSPGYIAGDNYVTGLANQVNEIYYLQKSDAIDPIASNPAVRADMTLVEMLAILKGMFQVFWDIDSNGNLRLEHIKYWQTQLGLDLTTTLHKELLQFTSLSSAIPKYERFGMAESRGQDFVGTDIIYNSPCADPQEVVEIQIPNVCTDIYNVYTDPDAISKGGFVFLATTMIDGVRFVITDDGALTVTPVNNAPLAWANLHRDYYRWDRYMSSGNMNGVETPFFTVRPNIEQAGVISALCCDSFDFDPRDTVRTNLGQDYLAGRLAQVEKVAYEEKTNEATLTLQYNL